jgi:hypothetical protein
MDLDSLPSLEVDDDLFEDNDVLFGMEDNFDVMEMLIPLTITYRPMLNLTCNAYTLRICLKSSVLMISGFERKT